MAMQQKAKCSDPGADEGAGLPSSKAFLALAALGLLLLALAALSSERVVPPSQRGIIAAKALETPSSVSPEF